MFYFSWLIGCDLYFDDQTIGFKGRHVDNMIISYKSKGGGCQAYALCNRGYTYDFLLKKEVIPKEYTSTGISPLHACVFSLFLTLCNIFHKVLLDNIYMSLKFEHLSYTQHNCVKVEGVCKTVG